MAECTAEKSYHRVHGNDWQRRSNRDIETQSPKSMRAGRIRKPPPTPASPERKPTPRPASITASGSDFEVDSSLGDFLLRITIREEMITTIANTDNSNARRVTSTEPTMNKTSGIEHTIHLRVQNVASREGIQAEEQRECQ